MEFLQGALAMSAFLFCLYAAYHMGQKKRPATHKEPDELERRKAERLRQGFQQMMSYDVSTAYGKKVE